MAVPCNLVYESDKGPSREKRDCDVLHNMTTGFHFRRLDRNSAQCVKSYQKSANTLSLQRSLRIRPGTHQVMQTHTTAWKKHLALSDMGYWSPNEVHLVGSGLDGGLHRRGEGRRRGESVYLHPFITICLMAYECLHGYSRERERERWMEGQRWLRSER